MNKKLLLATMSLAVLAACTDNDFQSQNKNVAEEISPIQFELINGDGDATRASWNDASAAISFSATDGDLFTLYHGGTCAAEDQPLTGFENAIYTAQPGTPATLSTPSMIKAGMAVMVWPADTTFNSSNFTDGKFQITIPAEQTDFVNQLPYVSDLITIGAYTGTKHKPADYNTAGYDRKYPIFMRQMGSLLTLKADYAGTDAELAKLYEGGAEAGDDPIKPIELTGVTLSTKATGATKFTKQIPVKFTAANANWPVPATLNHKWTYVTSFDAGSIVDAEQTATLSAKEKSLLPGNQGAKIIILPSKSDADIDEAAVIVETYYGKVVVAAHGVAGSEYTDPEYAKAWSRYLTDPSTKTTFEEITNPVVKDADNKTKVTSNIVKGMTQTINWFSSADRKSTNATVKTEPVGGNLTRYVTVLLNHLDMSELHVKSDKQLRDVVRVWKKMNLPAVTVYLDGGKEGDAEGEFTISQKTIETINTINNGTLKFQVKPCNVAGEKCNTIVVTGASTKAEVQNIAFITYNDVDESGTFNAGDVQAKVVLAKETTAWQWKGTVKVQANGVAQIINKGIMTNAAAATLKTAENDGTQNNVPLVNDGTWNITAGDLTVQFDVTNNGTVNIKKGAEYHQDIIAPATVTTFTNEALSLPGRFLADPEDEEIGLVNNAGVFAVTGTTAKKGVINNYGLIEHGVYPGEAYNKDAKTFITANQQGADPSFATAFNKTDGSQNKLGRINLPYSNKDEDNISVNAALSTGFVSVTVASGDAPVDKKLNLTVVGDKVNYVIIKGGIETVTEMTAAIKYIEFDDENDTEIAWQAGTSTTPVTATYDGLIVLSPVNIKLYTTVDVKKATYLGAKMYVGGELKYNGGAIADALWNGYYGETKAKVPSMYITY